MDRANARFSRPKPPKDREAIRRSDLLEALAKRSIEPEELERAPQITSLLSKAKGGLPEVLRAARFSQNPTIQKFVRAIDKASEKDREVLPWEAFCIAEKIDPTELLGAIVLALREDSVAAVKILLMSHHTDTVKARIRSARKPQGVKDRDAVDQALGLLPSPKGPTFISRMVVNQGGAEQDARGDEPGEIDIDFAFPNLAETQKTIRKSLPPGKE